MNFIDTLINGWEGQIGARIVMPSIADINAANYPNLPQKVISGVLLVIGVFIQRGLYCLQQKNISIVQGRTRTNWPVHVRCVLVNITGCVINATRRKSPNEMIGGDSPTRRKDEWLTGEDTTKTRSRDERPPDVGEREIGNMCVTNLVNGQRSIKNTEENINGNIARKNLTLS